MEIRKSEYYEVGAMSITAVVGKERKLEFDQGLVIEVTEEELSQIDVRYYEVVNG